MPRRTEDLTDLSTCVLCRRDFVVPVDWEPVGAGHWWMFLRCAECGVSREVTVTDAVAAAYDEQLADGARDIARTLLRLDLERMAGEIERFTAALDDGHVIAADFAA